MGLFINTSDHPDVYKNEQPLYETNQLFSRNDYLSELLIEQQKPMLP
ncbi:MAG: hypothetical protein K6T88_12355 [Bacillus sp. (in: Bacteria)]|nr:hypothetical protein [Bacillus sp. (in: firmicutes)]